MNIDFPIIALSTRDVKQGAEKNAAPKKQVRILRREISDRDIDPAMRA